MTQIFLFSPLFEPILVYLFLRRKKADISLLEIIAVTIPMMFLRTILVFSSEAFGIDSKNIYAAALYPGLVTFPIYAYLISKVSKIPFKDVLLPVAIVSCLLAFLFASALAGLVQTCYSIGGC